LVLLKIACLPVHRFFLASFFYVTVKVLLARNRTGRIFPSVFLFVPSVRAVDNIFPLQLSQRRWWVDGHPFQ
jgi:hypothetical protein